MASTAEVAADVERVVLQKIAAGSLALPSMRVAVVRCLSLLSKEGFSFRDVVREVEQDPVLAARILSVTNSAAFAGPEPARSILAAVTRLGAKNLRTVLLEAAVHQVFESADARIAAASRGLLTHSRAVAFAARHIAKSAMLEDPENAYLTGLLHDIGKPVVAMLLLRSEKNVRGERLEVWFDADTWIELVQRSHRSVGVALAKVWKLPDAVALAIENCVEYDDAFPRSTPNCVRFANALAKEQGLYVGDVDPAQNDAIVRVGQLMLGLETAEVNELREQIRTHCAS